MTDDQNQLTLPRPEAWIPSDDEARWAAATLSAQRYGREVTADDLKKAAEIMSLRRQGRGARAGKRGRRVTSPLEVERHRKALLDDKLIEAQGINAAREGEAVPDPVADPAGYLEAVDRKYPLKPTPEPASAPEPDEEWQSRADEPAPAPEGPLDPAYERLVRDHAERGLPEPDAISEAGRERMEAVIDADRDPLDDLDRDRRYAAKQVDALRQQERLVASLVARKQPVPEEALGVLSSHRSNIVSLVTKGLQAERGEYRALVERRP